MKRCAYVQITLLTVVLICNSCSGPTAPHKNGDTIFFPDTTAFIQSWKMNEKQMRGDLFTADTTCNQLGLDTFELTYRPCECPDWIDMNKVALDCKECSDFYVDPADPSLVFPDAFLVHGNTVRFFGVRIPEMGLPVHREFENSNPPKWTVIKYYGYEVVRPYRVWGPRPRFYDQLNDSIDTPLELTIH
jgi:hypothetical protein